ncbi:MAG: hypothetical protein V7722_05890, partial [Porticoccus sp.]
MLKRLCLLFNTVRFLKVKQIVYQVYYRIFRHVISEVTDAKVRTWKTRWAAPSWQSPSFLGRGKLRFLGKVGVIRAPEDWSSTQYSRLWLYNLHYFDDLNATDAHIRRSCQLQLIDDWLSANILKVGVGWEPYVLSLRIVNFVKYFSILSGERSLDQCWVDSVATQAKALSNLLEFHILGNHL